MSDGSDGVGASGAQPGWWMGSDGKLYPPEDHPDVRSATPASPPPSPPASPPDRRVHPRSALIGGVAALVTIALLAAAGFAVTMLLGRLPPPEADQELLEAALPDASELPPGLVKDDSDETNSDDSSCDTISIEPRARAEVAYVQPTSLGESPLGDGAVAANASSYETPKDAKTEFDAATAAALTTCLRADGISFTETTGGVDKADASRLFAAEGAVSVFYLGVAVQGRFMVAVIMEDAEDTLDQTSEILEALS